MNHADVAPTGREEQVRALKGKPGIDNPFAVAWASYNGDDEDEDSYDAAGVRAFADLVGQAGGETSAFSLSAPSGGPGIPGVAGTEKQMKGHTGMQGTYGQPRGEAPARPAALEIAGDKLPHQNMAADAANVQAFQKAMGDAVPDLDDDEPDEQTKPGKPAQTAVDEDGEFDADQLIASAGQVAARNSGKTGGHTVSTFGVTDNDMADVDLEEALGLTGTEPASVTIESEEAPSETPPVDGTHAHGTSAGAIAVPATSGQEVLHGPTDRRSKRK